MPLVTTAASPGVIAADEPIATATAPPDSPAPGPSGRAIVRIGAFLFALGSIATYAAAGTRRHPVREVDLDGRDL